MSIARISEGDFEDRKLGDVVEFLDHLRKPIKESDRQPGPYPYYGANGQQGTIDAYIFDEPLVLLAEDGGHFENPERGIAYLIRGKSWVNNHAHVLRARPEVIDTRFLCRVLENGDVSKWLTGTTRAKLTKAGAAEIRLRLPSLPVQRRIADILDKADALRVKRREAAALVDLLERSTFLQMFGDPAANSKNWIVGSVGDLLDSADYGTSVKSGASGQFPVLRMNNILPSGRMDLTELKFMDLPAAEHQRYLVRTGDILFNRTNSVDLVGKTAVYRGSSPMAYAGYLIRLRTGQDHNPEYLAAYLNTDYAKRVLRGMCKSIIGMANINATELKKIRVAIPPKELQDRYAATVEQLTAFRRRQMEGAEKLDELFLSLQHRAFRGDLTV